MRVNTNETLDELCMDCYPQSILTMYSTTTFTYLYLLSEDGYIDFEEYFDGMKSRLFDLDIEKETMKAAFKGEGWFGITSLFSSILSDTCKRPLSRFVDGDGNKKWPICFHILLKCHELQRPGAFVKYSLCLLTCCSQIPRVSKPV